MDELNIFVESSERIGILFDGYKPLLPKTESFLTIVSDYIEKLNKDPQNIDVDIKEDMDKYRKDALQKIEPKAIELSKIKPLTKAIKDFQNKCESLLQKYIKAKDKISYGGNYIRAIIKKPKVYVKDPSEEAYSKVNANVRQVNRAMDWIEKVIMDLYNMADQDLNILEIIDRVYKKQKIFESGYAVVEDVADNVLGMLPESRVSTTDKKTSQPAPYIKNNHDMATFGEEEPEKEPSIDDYKRPAKEEEPKDDTKEDEVQDTDDVEPVGSEPSAKEVEDDIKTATRNKTSGDYLDKGGNNNYYYYTYNNSLNDQSQHTDDHSTNKAINSYNNKKDDEKEYRAVEAAKVNPLDIIKVKKQQNVLKDIIKDQMKKAPRINLDDIEDMDEDEEKKESSMPWELNLGLHTFMEEATTNTGLAEMEQLKSILGRDVIDKDIAVPAMVSFVFDDGKRSLSTDDVLRFEIPVKVTHAFDNNGNRLPDTSFTEVPLAAYYLKQIADQGVTINAKYSVDIQTPLESYLINICREASQECSQNIIENVKNFHIEPKYVALKPNGQIGIAFSYDLDPEHGLGINITGANKEVTIGDDQTAFESVIVEAPKPLNKDMKKMIDDKIKNGETISLKDLDGSDSVTITPDDPKKPIEPMKILIKEEAGDVDDQKPKSDHPIKDVLMDIDRASTKVQQKAKKAVQDVVNVGKAATKPIKRTKQWISNLVNNWKDANETNIKEKMADPYARKGLFSGIKKAITVGALFKAGILLNPVFLFLGLTKKISNNSKEFRIRNEMIGELKTEMDVVQMKIDNATNPADKAKLMRFKNELNKKLLRVGGGKRWAKVI